MVWTPQVHPSLCGSLALTQLTTLFQVFQLARYFAWLDYDGGHDHNDDVNNANLAIYNHNDNDIQHFNANSSTHLLQHLHRCTDVAICTCASSSSPTVCHSPILTPLPCCRILDMTTTSPVTTTTSLHLLSCSNIRPGRLPMYLSLPTHLTIFNISVCA